MWRCGDVTGWRTGSPCRVDGSKVDVDVDLS